jgi:fructokinase
MHQLSVLSIGELLWDMLPTGPRLGGAPFNVVAHMARLGHAAAILSAVGDDELGRCARAEVERLGVRTDVLQTVAAAPTGTVAVEFDAEGHPSYVIETPVAYEYVTGSRDVLDSVRALDPAAVVFGTLAQRSGTVRAATEAVLATQPDAVPVYDVNLREGCWTPALVDELLRFAKILKLNEDELGVLGSELGLDHSDIPSFAADATRRYPQVSLVCVTQGGKGAVLWTREAQSNLDGLEVRVVDTVGAGDAFTAGLIHGLLAGMLLPEIGRLANALGALVASREGAVPAWSAEDLAGFADLSP